MSILNGANLVYVLVIKILSFMSISGLKLSGIRILSFMSISGLKLSGSFSKCLISSLTYVLGEYSLHLYVNIKWCKLGLCFGYKNIVVYVNIWA